jgi:hypothetical protein
MSKLLTVLFSIIALVSLATIRDDATTGSEQRLLVLAGVLGAAVLAVLLATRREIPREQRRGKQHASQPLMPIRALLALPWLILALGGWLVIGLVLLLGELSDTAPGGGERMPSISPRRVVRHAWRLWAVGLGAALALGVLTEQLDGDSSLMFVFGIVGLVATRLATRWMDRTDARGEAAPITGVLQRTHEEPSSRGPFL